MHASSAIARKPILVALAWCWLSLSWAIEPLVALRRVLLLSIVIWSVFLMVQRLGYRSTLTLVRGALVVLLVANFVAVFLFPQTGVHQIDPLGDWLHGLHAFLQVVDPSGHVDRGAGVEHGQVALGAGLAGEDRARGAGVVLRMAAGQRSAVDTR